MEFWERNFIEKQEMWGDEAAKSTTFAVGFFLEHNIKNILIPGFGYGRNGRPFLENGIKITGIEISKTAIELARKSFGTNTISIMVRLMKCLLIRIYMRVYFVTGLFIYWMLKNVMR